MDIRRISFGDYSADINLTLGANCIRLYNSKYGVSVLREPDYAHLDSKYLYGMPILFPVNRILAGSFSFEGRAYKLPINEPSTGCFIHGELHLKEFLPIEVEESRILCRYVATEESPYLTFGHSFSVDMEYSLSDEGLLHKVSIKNLSSENMPCMLGFHTTFNTAPYGNGGVAKAYIRREFERNMKVYLPTGRCPEPDDVYRAFSEGRFPLSGMPISRHYEVSGSAMELISPEGGFKCVYENDEKYKFRLVFNGKADEYICLEPHSCLVNAPNMPMPYEESGFDFIPAGDTKVYTSKIYLTNI